jgi:hypothetical protein
MSDQRGLPWDKFKCKLCGGLYTRAHKSCHLKTNKHKMCLKMVKNMNNGRPYIGESDSEEDSPELVSKSHRRRNDDDIEVDLFQTDGTPLEDKISHDHNNRHNKHHKHHHSSHHKILNTDDNLNDLEKILKRNGH